MPSPDPDKAQLAYVKALSATIERQRTALNKVSNAIASALGHLEAGNHACARVCLEGALNASR